MVYLMFCYTRRLIFRGIGFLILFCVLQWMYAEKLSIKPHRPRIHKDQHPITKFKSTSSKRQPKQQKFRQNLRTTEIHQTSHTTQNVNLTDPRELIDLKMGISVGNVTDKRELTNMSRPMMSRSGFNMFTEYEKTRRLLESDVNEFWYNIQAVRDKLDNAQSQKFGDLYEQLKANLMKIEANDGFEKIRRQETINLSNTIQKRIRDLQNPKDCHIAKKIVCELGDYGCGLGCSVHHVGYCLIVAYATSRTLILKSSGWRYSPSGWDKVFLPLSDTCLEESGSSTAAWNDGLHGAQVLYLPLANDLTSTLEYLPHTIPLDLAEPLERIHGSPNVFWVGEIMKYVLRVQPEFDSKIETIKQQLKLELPTVGIHVRRTDKKNEAGAKYHSLKEYMHHAGKYFRILDNFYERPIRRRVFIATDEPRVLYEARRRYRNEWEILGDVHIAKSAAKSKRTSAVAGILQDIFVLAECAYVVCTYTSNICRLANELMQSKHTDASGRIMSLDVVYPYFDQIGVLQIATKSHVPQNNSGEIEIKIGDLVSVNGHQYEWKVNGHSMGTNLRTKMKGLIPSYKLRPHFQRADIPLVQNRSLLQAKLG